MIFFMNQYSYVFTLGKITADVVMCNQFVAPLYFIQYYITSTQNYLKYQSYSSFKCD